mmetsp:Transcript_30954/g.50072  ORF Transcript_30954/g.50072 Transcript_30954/m.50072 type:complete len:429 (-) Transcript_30954:479-1765(-)|eukprot:CAMPEP_0184666194 /NCGR_PEP_ID=MMETSP0308-20130426/60323_1 /TAXON_ID=38269 /ORGANISM="Gloeochaete witrockiana, Strain SAG 46.84" /LENGTH=428 /DNA_ID=CAMNT_0027110645 /DNA_START=89 /DNA_END=1375 /DNA_ORIENTATION=+
MARKKIREHDAKQLLRKNLQRFSSYTLLNLRCVEVTPDTDLKKLAAENPWLATEKLVVKPDMLFGQRGKNNLVLLNKSLAEAEVFLAERIGKEIEHNGVKGVLTNFIVEPFCPHEGEYYFSISSNRLDNTIRFSPAGGINVEEHWDEVRQLVVPIDESIDNLDEKITALVASDLIPEERQKKIVPFIKGVYKVFDDLDFTLLEMNPFTFDKDGYPIPLDMRAELDSTALFKNVKKWNDIQFPQPWGRRLFPEEKKIQLMDEKTGASLKLTLLNPGGRIWTMVAGGGASVIYTDTVVDMGYGHELGNYAEYSGNPNENETYQFAKTLLDLATRNPDGRRRALLIGGGVANFTDVAATFTGIISALKEFSSQLVAAKMRIYVRRGGPNYQAGLKMMKELEGVLGVPIDVYGPETNMTRIVKLAIDYLNAA